MDTELGEEREQLVASIEEKLSWPSPVLDVLCALIYPPPSYFLMEDEETPATPPPESLSMVSGLPSNKVWIRMLVRPQIHVMTNILHCYSRPLGRV